MLIKVFLILFLIYFIYAPLPTIYYKIKTKIIRRNKGNKIYLTFDDGPSEKYTPLLLALLKKYNIKASFFCVGNQVKKYPYIIKRMKSENHLIGTHSYKHTSAYLMNINTTNKDFKKTKEIIKSSYYRPPWGIINLVTIYNIKKYKLKLVLWNVMVGDWKANITNTKITNLLLKKIKPGDIICLHDNNKNNNSPLKMIKSLEEIIPKLIKEGYKFETVDKYYEEKR